ncbi:hypothetical protein [Microcoleus sp. CAWBG58]|uniref:hypothetical protein n=1 Tax=Microcoleus sp. CAWBG58 TaxID=2841651 RepID=UPI0025CCA837|nr:hypothetical protein [Microcoleus sp. CAWBG58]
MKEEGSSATESVADVTDVTDGSPIEVVRRKKERSKEEGKRNIFLISLNLLQSSPISHSPPTVNCQLSTVNCQHLPLSPNCQLSTVNCQLSTSPNLPQLSTVNCQLSTVEPLPQLSTVNCQLSTVEPFPQSGDSSGGSSIAQIRLN